MEETKKKKSRLTREDRKMILFMFWGIPLGYIVASLVVVLLMYISQLMYPGDPLEILLWENELLGITVEEFIPIPFILAYVYIVGKYWSIRFLKGGGK
ncbi:hypothetical protein [Oligella urethralis]|uniref:hypothetical protein n=1 Tax=Oligella urethralis TaxID=90245 RepID=UPI00288BE712|nr:hypothetical protein [Oligella urethralis]